MTPSEQAKALGCKSLAAVSEAVGVSVQTLTNWHRDRPAVFVAVCEYTARRTKC